jgi:glucose-6-phosphate 1-dehydrogenase
MRTFRFSNTWPIGNVPQAFGHLGLSLRDDEAELAWQVLTPVIRAWSADTVPMEEYPAGSSGPPARDSEPQRELHSLDLGVH